METGSNELKLELQKVDDQMKKKKKKKKKCPYLLSSETTAKGTGLEKLAGKEDPVELDSSLAL